MKETLYHPIVARGLVIYLPSSLPDNLRKFVDLNHLIRDEKLANFKNKVNALRAK